MMRNIFLITFALVALVLTAAGQSSSKVHYEGRIGDGEFITFNADKADSLDTDDTISYTFIMNQKYENSIWIEQRHDTAVGDTTITLNLYESTDGTTWHALKKWTSPTNNAAATVTYTIGKGDAAEVVYNGGQELWSFGGKWLKLMYISVAHTGLKGIFFGTIKTKIK